MVANFGLSNKPSDGSPNRAGQVPRHRSPFDAIRHIDEDADQGEFEWWSAREAMPHLGYERWENMRNVIRKAMTACRNSGHQVSDNFRDITKVSAQRGPGQADTQMRRFGMYLLAMNGDPDKPEIAAAQRYFAMQTYRAESAESLAQAPTPYRAWSERLSRSIMDHRCYIAQNLPKGAFSIYTGTIPDILAFEDVMVEHLLPLLLSDSPDNSIGQRWPKRRQGQSWLGKVYQAPLWMPSQQIEVPVYVYSVCEWAHFREWLEGTYLPENLPEYLSRKFPLRTYGLTPPSAAG